MVLKLQSNKVRNSGRWRALALTASIVISGPGWLATVAAASPAHDRLPLMSQQGQTQLVEAIKRYKLLADGGGWVAIATGAMLEPGETDARVGVIRARLQSTGDLPLSDLQPNNFYDPAMLAGVQAFQRRHGVLPDGRIGPDTLQAMNVPTKERLAQLQSGLDQLKQLAKSVTASRYLLVNIPALELTAVNQGKVELDSAVVIGRSDRQTPELVSRITAVNFHPTWHVPASIVKRDLFPTLQRNPQYMVRENYQVLRADTGAELTPGEAIAAGLKHHQIRLRKAPGPTNPLGRIRLDMPNTDAIFLHDSPASWLFSRAERALSSGCVRVARIVELSAWLLDDNAQWDLPRIGQALRAPDQVTARLAASVPVHLVYITAWADPDGRVQFRHDVYGRRAAAAQM